MVCPSQKGFFFNWKWLIFNRVCPCGGVIFWDKGGFHTIAKYHQTCDPINPPFHSASFVLSRLLVGTPLMCCRTIQMHAEVQFAFHVLDHERVFYTAVFKNLNICCPTPSDFLHSLKLVSFALLSSNAIVERDLVLIVHIVLLVPFRIWRSTLKLALLMRPFEISVSLSRPFSEHSFFAISFCISQVGSFEVGTLCRTVHRLSHQSNHV